MSEVKVSSSSTLTLLSRFPWMLLLIVFLLGAEFLELPMTGTTGYVFIGFAVAIMFIEIFKSSDTGAMGFFLDQFWAVLSLVLATGLLSYLWFTEGKEPSFYHWLGFAMIVADALLSPLNAYRTALRNFDVPG
ncbi:hypothetical protein [Thiosulfativibrio zosterae]|uniref:Uncharacterized protein n=1 Tax=Thiosulfativibrio zosterae TaxID=2675053 RepID=A0A6F8PR40_9GAMM|nr:hypothetical protein [Thiosulfativibrio zosterae]BBP44579.1 hypothetical protein THMIRHAT_23250 [Thiosulfativibrio zosterae]